MNLCWRTSVPRSFSIVSIRSTRPPGPPLAPPPLALPAPRPLEPPLPGVRGLPLPAHPELEGDVRGPLRVDRGLVDRAGELAARELRRGLLHPFPQPGELV